MTAVSQVRSVHEGCCTSRQLHTSAQAAKHRSQETFLQGKVLEEPQGAEAVDDLSPVAPSDVGPLVKGNLQVKVQAKGKQFRGKITVEPPGTPEVKVVDFE
ncbi:hypothetical protein HPB47_020252 [Ixodes persulcatus]|uniref:Uncharacterized protein n=1 Tax=Ixodes persulcatus TaxID=34615 RepID=A0AC60QG48_IXOPE|nr:hypothetical protein HPB47_020252 [Ixodes persulcatus]